MNTNKLDVEDFYHQFHGHHHHKDPGDYTKPEWHKLNPKLEKRHKKFDLKAFRNSKRKKSVVVHKDSDTIRYEMTMKKKAK
jgi:hypothetical protein